MATEVRLDGDRLIRADAVGEEFHRLGPEALVIAGVFWNQQACHRCANRLRRRLHGNPDGRRRIGGVAGQPAWPVQALTELAIKEPLRGHNRSEVIRPQFHDLCHLRRP